MESKQGAESKKQKETENVYSKDDIYFYATRYYLLQEYLNPNLKKEIKLSVIFGTKILKSGFYKFRYAIPCKKIRDDLDLPLKMTTYGFTNIRNQAEKMYAAHFTPDDACYRLGITNSQFRPLRKKLQNETLKSLSSQSKKYVNFCSKL
jgi:hypothetical protein